MKNAPAHPPHLRIENLRVVLGDGPAARTVLDPVHLEVPGGELAAIIGPSGCGKSTFLNALIGLSPFQNGRIMLDGRTVPNLLGRAAYMQQNDLLMPWRTVLENASLYAELHGLPRKQARMEAVSMLAHFGLEGFAHYYPDQLSGGMRQRAALLRTVLCRKNILLLDEPFGALDALTRRRMQQWLLRARTLSGATVILVTHDVEEAVLLAGRVLVMAGHPARIVFQKTITESTPRQPADPALIRIKEALLQALEDES